MPGENPNTKKFSLKWPLIMLAIIFILLIGLSSAYWSYAANYQDKIYRGVKVGSLQLGGLTYNQALEKLTGLNKQIEQQGFTFFSGNKKYNIGNVINPGGGPELSLTLFTGDPEKTAQQAFALGRNRQANHWPLSNILRQISLLIFGQRINYNYQLQEQVLLTNLQALTQAEQQPAQNAKLQAQKNGDLWQITVLPEQEGRIINYDQALTDLKDRLANASWQPVELTLTKDRPTVNANQAQKMTKAAETFLNASSSPLLLTYQDKNWSLTKEKIAAWLEVQKQDGELVLGLNQTICQNFLDTLAKEINITPQTPKFSLANGKVTEFQKANEGQTLDTAKSCQTLSQQLTSWPNKLELVVNTETTDIAVGDLNNLGIKEIIGSGHSNFKGSPTNRRHNISVGAKTLNGLLIKPGEEFSIIKALGTIDEAAGYLPELVIKENKTVPEFGGGLCQIGTTVFRAALYSGLPITARANHSYRVTYYEPAGLDATIYDPAPDLKFLNDTGYYILIQARIEGNDLYFDFWGTKDQRQITVGQPNIYNVVQPPAQKNVETTELKPGQKKCTESAHAGADADFLYKVVYPNGETKEKTFHSHYRPWQAVCLIGVAKIQTATTTSPTLPTTTSTSTVLPASPTATIHSTGTTTN